MSTFSSILLAVVGLIGALLGWKLKGGLASRELNKAKDAVLEAEQTARAEQARRVAAQDRAKIMESKARSIENALKEKEVLAGKEQKIDEETPNETGNCLDHMFNGFNEPGAGGHGGVDRVSGLPGSDPAGKAGKD